MGFEYQLDYYENSEMSIKLFFDDPAFISKDREPDILVVRLKNTEIFTSAEGEPIDENVEARSPLRPQIGNESAAVVLKGIAVLTATLVGTNFIANVILNLSVSQSMSMMISLVK
jgi:hypothetical protein